MEASEWHVIISELKPELDEGEPSPHKPLALLYLFGRAQQDLEAGVSYLEFEAALKPALLFVQQKKYVEPHLPFWHLQDGFWKVSDIDRLDHRQGKPRPTITSLRDVNPDGRVRDDLWQQLRTNPRLASELANEVLDRFLPHVDRTQVSKMLHVDLGKSRVSPRHFGEIAGCPEGERFESRRELSDSGIHRPLQAGISGSGVDGSDSIVVSGGYEDDEDHGDWIVYTGHGGQDLRTREQVADQEFRVGNKGLAISCDRGLPVRVVRGTTPDAPYAPAEGYRYDGLYSVERYWRDRGKAGFIIWRFSLVKINDKRPPIRPDASPPPGDERPGRAEGTVVRIIRDTKIGRWVKELYDCRCQVCDETVDTPTEPYAEAAHLKPLGRPHDGPDVAGNILCLCPNHHVQIDKGALAITDEHRLVGLPGSLAVHDDHSIDPEYLAYHREHILVD